MEQITVPVVIAVAIWGGYGHLLKSYEVLNRDRDRILRGKDEHGELSIEHQQMIVDNDWSPLHFGLIAYLSTFCALFVALPLITEMKIGLKIVCWFMALCPAYAAVAFFTGWRSDKERLDALIEGRRAASVGSSAAPAPKRRRTSRR